VGIIRGKGILKTRIAPFYTLRPLQLWLGIVVVAVITLPLIAGAVTTISQGYSTTDTLSVGSIVSLKDGTSDQVVAGSSGNVDSLLGVVINNGSSLLTVSNGSDSQVQVATSGTASVLVSDINGPVVKGDQITASPVVGVGMKATTNAKVVGVAQSAPSNSNKDQSYTDSQGKEQSITLGEVQVQVGVTYFYAEPDKTLIPPAIQNLANALAGKTVNSLPIIISAVIFIITLIVVVAIIYSMIRSSIISVGRNPMSQSAVYRDVIQLSALVLGILAVAVIAIYVILTRF
jgi:hypothetical protein